MTAQELLKKWRTEEAEQVTPERAKICNDFAVLLEKAINEGNEIGIKACLTIQEEIDGLNYVRMGLGEVKGLPDYLDALNSGLKPFTAEEIRMQSKVLQRLTSDEALKAINKKKESEN